MVGRIWGQTRLFGTGDANRGTGTMSGMDQIGGQTRGLDDRTLDQVDLPERRSGGRDRL